MNRQDFYYDQLVKQMDLDLLQDNAERGIGAGLKDTWGTGLTSIDIIAHEKGTPDMNVLVPAGSARVQETGTISTVGTLTNGSPIITDIPNTARLSKGDSISGTGVPGSTKILSIDGITQITMDKNATADGAAVSLTITYIKYTRAIWIGEQTIDCSQDWETNSTIPAAGKECYIACYVKQKRDLFDQRQDGWDPPNTIDYRQVEGAEFRVYKGADANPGSASKVSSPGSEFELVFEVLFDENTTAISDAANEYYPIKDEIDITDVIFIHKTPKLKSYIFNASGKFIVPKEVTKLMVTIWGGGGGGGAGAAGEGGGGGGSSEIIYRKMITVISKDLLTITIGAGGAGSNDGVNTTITGTGVSETALGGKKGVDGNGGSGIGGNGGGIWGGAGGAVKTNGNAGICQIFISGGAGGGGGSTDSDDAGDGANCVDNTGGAGGSGSSIHGGGGGAGFNGNGAAGAVVANGGDANANSGAGGGGGRDSGNFGGAGGSGGCIIEWVG